MITRLDHVVIGVRDLDEAMQAFQQLGFDVRPGGRHTGRGTHNALIRFGLDYLELLAICDESEVTPSDEHGQFMLEYLRERSGALLGFAFASDNLEDEAGYSPGKPFAMQRARPDGVQTEVFAYGRLPLAFSARCFTARQRNLPRENCQYVCIEHPDGLMLRTREGQPFLVLNGISIQSARVYNLVDSIDRLKALGVDVLRLSPQSEGMSEVVGIFRDVADGRLSGAQALERMAQLMPESRCDGYWHGMPGLARKQESTRVEPIGSAR